MTDQTTPTQEVLAETMAKLDRRRMMRRAGIGALAAAVAATAGSPAHATNQGAGPADTDILNFALNLEYLEAQFYLYAVTGSGLPANLTTGTGRQGTTGRGEKVPFSSPMVAGYALNLARDETEHVRFIRNALGGSAVAIPDIDVGVGPNNIFSQLAVVAGLISAGQTFDPYANDAAFLLGASIFEDVGVTAYGGAARYIGNPDYVEAAAAILAVEAYHAGGIRSLLLTMGLANQFNAISAVRGRLSNASGGGTGEGPLDGSQASYTFVPVGTGSLAYRRSARQVLNIVYGAPNAARGGFFPQGLNGNITN